MTSTATAPSIHIESASIDKLKVRGIENVGASKRHEVTPTNGMSISQANFNGGTLTLKAEAAGGSVAVDVDSVEPGTVFSFDVYQTSGIDSVTLALSSACDVSGVISYSDGSAAEQGLAANNIVIVTNELGNGRLTVCVIDSSTIRLSGICSSAKAAPLVTFS